MVYDQDYDWDYYEFGADEQKEKEKMQGIAKFDEFTVFRNAQFKDAQFNMFEIMPVMKDLEDKYSLFAKDSELLKTGKNLKNKAKQPRQVQANISQAQIPKQGHGNIFSADDFQRVKSGGNIVSFPQTAIGIVLVAFKDGTILRGTGSLIGPNHVLTCAHILYRQGQKKDANIIVSINFFPGLCVKSLIYEEVQILKAIVLSAFIQGNEPENNDIAVLILDKAIGLQCGWFGIINLPDETLLIEKSEVSGYPKDKDQEGYVQYSDKGKLDHINKETLEYKLDASLGQNGGPLYVERQINQQIVEYYLQGVHIGFNGKRNYAVRINQDKFAKIREIIEFHFINEALDESYYLQQIVDQNTVQMNFENTHASYLNIQSYIFTLRHNVGLQEVILKIRTIENTNIINNDLLKELAGTLKFLINLKSLRLDLFNCENLTDESLKILCNGLMYNKELQHLWIILNQNQKISNTGLKDLTICLHTLINIETLTLFLYNIGSISDEGIKFLAANIIKLPNIVNLKLDLQVLKKVTEKGVKEMCTVLSQAKTLQRVNLIILGIKISDQIKNQLKDLFSFVKQLQII